LIKKCASKEAWLILDIRIHYTWFISVWQGNILYFMKWVVYDVDD